MVDPDDPPTESEFADSIIRLVQDTVASDLWKDNGGTIGSIREINGLLVVSIGSPQQEQIRQLLDKIRAMLRERDARPLEQKLRATTAPTGAP